MYFKNKQRKQCEDILALGKESSLGQNQKSSERISPKVGVQQRVGSDTASYNTFRHNCTNKYCKLGPGIGCKHGCQLFGRVVTPNIALSLNWREGSKLSQSS